MNTARIEDLLIEAYPNGKDCPSPESWLAESLDAMSEAERKRAESHAHDCPACASERELARAFDAAPVQPVVAGEDIADVVRRLARDGATAPVTTRATGVRGWGLAAAAMFLIAAGGWFVIQRSAAPDLPQLDSAPVFRGDRLEILEPRGAVDETPQTIRWEAVSGAASYRVILRRIDRIELETEVSGTSLAIPANLSNPLEPMVVYSVQIEALDREGKRILRSEVAEFRIRP